MADKFRKEVLMLDLVICAIFKNEGAYLYEWLSYHAYQGVKHFYLYDNNSDDNSRKVIASWPEQERITIIDWPTVPGQFSAYQHMIQSHSTSTSWCAFLDCDEFLRPREDVSLDEALSWLDARCQGFYAHWLMFGSSGHIEARPGFVTERFVRRAYDSFPPNRVGKSIVRLTSALEVGNCHVIRCRGEMLNDSGDVIDQFGSGIHTDVSHRLVAINHYYTKSLDEWRRRRAFGRADMSPGSPDFRRSEEDFHRHDQNVMEDLTAFRITQCMKPLYYRERIPAPELQGVQ